MAAETTLPPAVDGALHRIDRRSGPLSYYVAGEGPPMLLIHSVNAAASAYEFKPVFERMVSRYRVFAVDLPGFGMSDRSKRTYDIRLYADAVLDMIDTIGEAAPAVPVHVLAISLGCEFAARAATEMPERFRSLAMVTPTGFDRNASQLRQAGATKEIPGLGAFLRVPLWRRPLFDLLIRRNSIRFFLRKTFGSEDVDPGLIDYAYATAHQPGAENAPYAFVSGALFSKDIRTIFEALTLPVWVGHGTKGDFRDFTEIGWTRSRSNWTVEAFETGALVHFEKPDKFHSSLDRFLARVEASST